MLIRELRLLNFRNYKTLSVQFDPQINIFAGYNAQGKTNILEAIYLLAMGRSFRAVKDSEMITHDQSYSLVSGQVTTEATHTLELVLKRSGPKQFRFNKKDLPHKEFVGVFNVVLFTPDDLYLVKGSPGGRRRFLDWEISQVSTGYRSLLLDYYKVLQHRNSLLKSIAFENQDPKILEVWDQQLVELGSRLMTARADMIHKLGLLSRLMHRQISDGREDLELRYVPFFAADERISDGHKYDSQSIRSRFTEAVASFRTAEFKRGYSLVGPHRDDFQFVINGVDLKTFGSQGQQRTAILACRLAELEYMKSETGSYPTILLDDVTSELDQQRKHFLLRLLTKKIQTV
ncbi:MAG TPA: DNA replication/repair protein RecF, partial [Limnochordia bacterium]|nr:DNA replication/repair protein RecF [Limnochordia bacterium]